MRGSSSTSDATAKAITPSTRGNSVKADRPAILTSGEWSSRLARFVLRLGMEARLIFAKAICFAALALLAYAACLGFVVGMERWGDLFALAFVAALCALTGIWAVVFRLRAGRWPKDGAGR